MANATRTGYCSRLKSKAISLGIRGIRGINTSYPFALPVNMVASKTFGISFFTHSLVPLHSFGGSRFLNNIIGDPTFEVKLCGGIPHGSKELRNAVG
jgi:hypothetical protein